MLCGVCVCLYFIVESLKNQQTQAEWAKTDDMQLSEPNVRLFGMGFLLRLRNIF